MRQESGENGRSSRQRPPSVQIGKNPEGIESYLTLAAQIHRVAGNPGASTEYIRMTTYVAIRIAARRALVLA